MICYAPFLVMLLRRGAPTPFLALWVESPDLVVTAGAASG